MTYLYDHFIQVISDIVHCCGFKVVVKGATEIYKDMLNEEFAFLL